MLSAGSKKLAKFLKSNGIGPTQAARALGVTHPAVIAWCRGHRVPEPEMRSALETWTRGEVAREHWPLSDRERRAQAVTPFEG